MMLNPNWMIAGLGAIVLIAALALMIWVVGQKRQAGMLAQWALTPRPVFSPSERLVYRQLREALPHHVVLAKVPLLRFCRPTEPSQLGYWHGLLGPVYVSFIVCSPSGRVLAALDVESPKRPPSRRLATIKQEVLQACRIRYVKCNAEQLPNVSELQMLVPPQGLAGRASVPADMMDAVRKMHPTLAHAVRMRKSGRTGGTWADSAISTDSFFSPDSRIDEFAASEPPPLGAAQAAGGTPPKQPASPKSQNTAKPAPPVRVAEPAPGGLLRLTPGEVRPEDTLH